MTNLSLAESYLIKASKRLKILVVLLDESAYSDVVREAQEIVELALKGMLRQVGIEPPKWHDVGPILTEHRAMFPASLQAELDTLAAISLRLRKEREAAFYGDVDMLPEALYGRDAAERAFADAERVLAALAHFPGG